MCVCDAFAGATRVGPEPAAWIDSHFSFSGEVLKDKLCWGKTWAAAGMAENCNISIELGTEQAEKAIWVPALPPTPEVADHDY